MVFIVRSPRFHCLFIGGVGVGGGDGICGGGGGVGDGGGDGGAGLYKPWTQ